jgi:hypothetical protein
LVLKKLVLCGVAGAILNGCAIEGVGYDGRVDAFHNAAVDAREFTALNRGTRDAAWYAGWCAAIEPHLRRMSDIHVRVERYCAAMQSQPENAEAIRKDLATIINQGNATAVESRRAVLGALSESFQQAQAQREQQAAKSLYCTSQRNGNQIDTDCR